MALTITDTGINVSVTRETRAPTQQGFGVALFLHSDDTVTAENRVVGYTSMAGVAEDWDAADEVYKAASKYYGQSPKPVNFKVGRYDPGEAIADELDLMLAKDADFFCVIPNVALRDSSAITGIAAWVQSNDRIQFNTSNDALCKDSSDTTNIMYLLKQAGYSNTYTQYSSTVSDYPCASAFALLATVSYRGRNTMKTLKWKDLPGCTVEVLTANELAAIKGFNGNVLYSVSGIRMNDEGKCADGSWIDEVVIAYALAEEIRVRVFGLHTRTKTKIPLTEPGAVQVDDEVIGAMLQFKRNGAFADTVDDEGNFVPAFTVTHTPVAELSLVDKAARIAPDVQAVGRLAGAWHRGTISANLVL